MFTFRSRQTVLGISPPADRHREIYATLQPVFEEHDVPDHNRYFLYCAFDALIEDDLDHATVAESVEKGTVGTDAYEGGATPLRVFAPVAVHVSRDAGRASAGEG